MAPSETRVAPARKTSPSRRAARSGCDAVRGASPWHAASRAPASVPAGCVRASTAAPRVVTTYHSLLLRYGDGAVEVVRGVLYVPGVDEKRQTCNDIWGVECTLAVIGTGGPVKRSDVI
eukprot:2398825-Pyramimonas_sp.AAC.1